ncbi:hypothetical protein TrCOL_g4015 [Triparma columacea]|uniref:DOPA 4,5-dioxygenase n=1 Tax=Triparma columacea TaxID=722753 RepID=A0A9W7LD14_9STRA|nr:hypothetical protein TrCOL_g4015 [Triparma columacea]
MKFFGYAASLLLSLPLLTLSAPYDPSGGASYFTSHSTLEPLPAKAHNNDGFKDTPVLEYHFHVYFFQSNEGSVADAQRLRESIVEAVKEGDFVAVCHGVDETVLPNFNSTSEVPHVNMGPKGPHPAGSYEVWVPQEYLGLVTSHMMLNRGENSVLLHPLTRHCVEDHTGRIMWMGVPFNLDRTVLAFDEEHCDSPQYPELGLGYSA